MSANLYNYNSDGQVQCPYNPSHWIDKERLQVHLCKCAKSANITKQICPFNSSHRFDAAHMDEHVKVCPNRIEFDTFKYRMGESSTPGLTYIENRKEASVQNDEDEWALDAAPAYDPQEKIDNKNIIITMKNMSKSQRRAFRMQQRQNYSD